MSTVKDTAPPSRNECEHLPDGTVRIHLTRGQSTLVDADTFELVAPYRWFAQFHASTGFYAVAKINGRKVLMHRLLMIAPAGVDVDHCDGDGLNNSLANLRLASRSQNSANRKRRMSSNGTFKGVRRRDHTNRWIAEIGVAGKKVHVGSFHTAEEAARAYDAAAREAYGTFAAVNFPENGERQA